MADKNWQDDVRESAHKIWLAGLGALALAEQEGSKLFGELVTRGERYETEGKEHLKEAVRGAREEAKSAATDAASQAREQARRIADAAREMWGRTSEGVDQSVAKALEKVGIPSRDEIQALSRRVTELTLAVERLRTHPAPPGPRAPEGAGGETGHPSPIPGKITTEDDVTTTNDVTTLP